MCAACIKGLVYNLAQLAAVNGISKFNRELAEIHLLGTAEANLFIRNKGYINFAVRTVFLNDGFQCYHQVGNSSLVICAQYGGTVGGDKVAADIFVKLRMLAYLNVDLLFSVQQYIAALIVFTICGCTSGERFTSTVSICATQPTFGTGA